MTKTRVKGFEKSIKPEWHLMTLAWKLDNKLNISFHCVGCMNVYGGNRFAISKALSFVIAMREFTENAFLRMHLYMHTRMRVDDVAVINGDMYTHSTREMDNLRLYYVI